MAEEIEEEFFDSNAENAESLFNLCVRFCADNLSTFCTLDKDSDLYFSHEGIQLPADVTEALMDRCREKGILNEALLHAFSDPNKTKVRRLNVSNCSITDRTLRWFLPHGLTELDISNCSQSITTESLAYINQHGDSLRSLLIGSSWSLFVDIKHDTEGGVVSVRDFFKCPHLKAFSVHGIYDLAVSAKALLTKIMRTKSNLNYLDLSSCQVEVETMHYLEDMQQLTKLILYDVPIRDLAGTVKVLRKLRNLRALDLSQCKDCPVLYKEPEKHLQELVSGLPYLNWLDIAGTNLAGFLSPIPASHKPEKQSSDDSDSSNVRCAIPGLEGRQFRFLGLMDCPHEACERENIPAERVTGNATEEQIYLSAQAYVEKPVQLSRALNHLFSQLRFLPIRHLSKALQAVLLAMQKHPYNSQIQTTGCACLVFVIKKGERERMFNRQGKQKIINALLNAMDKHRTVLVLVKRACVAMSHFAIPDDLIFVYDRMVQLMLWFVEHSTDDQLRQICLHHLKFLSSQVEIHHKAITGDLGGISVMMNNIRRIVQSGFDCDQIMLRSWSILWSLTDMSPVNCEKFLMGGGIDLFLDCCHTYPGDDSLTYAMGGMLTYPDDDSLTKKMVGMLCNVAEVPWLRPALMENDQFVSKLIEFTRENITISNSAAGVLAHLVADNPSNWTVENPSRQAVRNRLRETVNSWDLDSRRNVRYRSFVPMLNLFSAYDTPESQHWATWEVCNMMIKDPDRYIRMFAEEGGIQLVEKIAEDPRPYPEIKMLARELLDMCHAHNPLLEVEG